MEEIKSEHEKWQEKKQGAKNKKSVKRKIVDDTVNKTKHKGKKNEKQKTIVDEDSDTSEEPKFDVSSDELTDIDEQIEKEIEDEHFVTGVVNVNNYVLVRFAIKKTHYIGQVLQKVEDEYFINFMRRKKTGFHFVYPDVKDKFFVPEEDVIKLSPPSFVVKLSELQKS
ncbi:hypothetical protein JTB14_002080 [Gonioctena quinquepunctata]|nr:hypothetical protein JTB14_002080 [Gonioctena quinquepunctata]